MRRDLTYTGIGSRLIVFPKVALPVKKDAMVNVQKRVKCCPGLGQKYPVLHRHKA